MHFWYRFLIFSKSISFNQTLSTAERRDKLTYVQYTREISATISNTRALCGDHKAVLWRRRTLHASTSFALLYSRPDGTGAARVRRRTLLLARPDGALQDAREGRRPPHHSRSGGAKAATVHHWHQFLNFSKMISSIIIRLDLYAVTDARTGSTPERSMLRQVKPALNRSSAPSATDMAVATRGRFL